MHFIIATFLAVVPGFPIVPAEHSLPLFFFPNSGLTDSSVKYIAQTPDLSVRFRPDTAIFQVGGQQLSVRFLGADPNVSIEGIEPLSARINFFLGDSAWKTDIPSYAKIVYRSLYPGIDMAYGGTGRQVKSEFFVYRGANPALIRLEYSEPVSIDAQGNLISGGHFREAAPEIYQRKDATRLKIEGRYRVLDTHTIGFEIGPYDSSVPLLIDPEISYSTYLGGSGVTTVTGVAVDSSASMYVTGWTEALNFPIDGAVQASNAGGSDIIVAKVNASGTGLLYATYIGGRGNDQGAAIAVDSLGQAYVTGSTSSSNFPLVLSNRSGLGGTTTAFALKLNATGNTLLYSGYLGGSLYDQGTAIAVDANFNAYVAGNTRSLNFPTLNPTQASLGGGTDAFLTKLNSTGTITFSTFLGGSGNEQLGGIALDSRGNIFVAGGTSSTDFPTVSPLQSTLTGSQAAFVTKISRSDTVAFSTYLGGSGGSVQQASAIAVDNGGNSYITGVTTSTTFPVTSGTFQTVLRGLENAFVTKMASDGQSLSYSTYLGGSGYDWAFGIAVSATGNAYVAGSTTSVDFPQVKAVQPSFGGLSDAFVSELNFAGDSLTFSTYYGGAGSDSAAAIALDTSANIFIGGQTSSSNLTLVNPIQGAIAASNSGWLMRMGAADPPPTTPSVPSTSPHSISFPSPTFSVSPNTGSGLQQVFTFTYSDTLNGANLTNVALLFGTSVNFASSCYVAYNIAANTISLESDSGTSSSSMTLGSSGTLQNSQCVIGATSAGQNGLSITLSVAVTFSVAFTGLQNIYMYGSVGSAGGSPNTGWVQEGVYTVNNGILVASSTVPRSGSGPGERFSFTVSDQGGAGLIKSAAILFASSFNLNNACYLVWDGTQNTISLFYDNPANGQTPFTPGAQGIATNEQCTMNAANSTVIMDATQIIITVDLTFNSTFFGAKNIYLYAAEIAANSGWTVVGTWTVTGGAATANSVSANSGSGASPTFLFTVSDSSSQTNLNGMTMLITSGAPIDTANACYLVYNRTAATIGLWDDTGNTTLSTKGIGSSANLVNSQCAVGYTVMYVSGNSIQLSIQLVFNTSNFAGAQSIYLEANEPSSNSGFVYQGGWTVP